MVEELELQTRNRLKKAIGYLKKSIEKCTPILAKDFASLNDDELESLEGLAGRFGRAADLATKRFLRGLLLQEEPDFSGSSKDLLNYSEKRGWIKSATNWMRLREVRNLIVHEYQEEDLLPLYREVLLLSIEIIKLDTIL